jgi:hypothetical protein
MTPVVLYGCETWCLTLRKEHRLRAFVKRGLKKIFMPEIDKIRVIRVCRKMHNGELHNFVKYN